jgi:multidrug efflux pump subunit AcrA (membrane-fusion protein)
MSARCSIIVARRKNALRLPVNCVQGIDTTAPPTAGGKGTVQIVTETMKDGKKTETTAPRDVQVGLRGDDFVEILSGVKENERVRPSAFTGPPRKAIDIMGDDGPDNRR